MRLPALPVGASPLVGMLVAALAWSCGNPPPAPVAPVGPPRAQPALAPVPAGPREVSLRYTAPEACPDVDGYLTHVRSRATNLDVQPEAERGAAAEESVAVNVEPEGEAASGWQGRVVIEGERALDREVHGERCEDVVAALALITVLRLEGGDASTATASAAGATSAPNAAGIGGETPGAAAGSTGAPAASAPGASADGTDAVRRPGSPAAPEAPAVPPGPEPTPAPAASPEPEPAPETPPLPEPPNDGAGTPAASPAPEPQLPEPELPEPELPEPLGPAPSITVPASERTANTDADEASEGDTARDDGDGGDDGAADADASSLALGGGLAVHVGYATVPGNALKAALEGELRFGESMSSWATLLSVAYARGSGSIPVADMDVTLLTAQLGLCPPAFIEQPSVWVRACASVRGGAFRMTLTSSVPIEPVDEGWHRWLAVGPSVELGVPLSEQWSLRGLAELAVQLVRDRLYGQRLSDRETFTLYRTDPLSFELAAGVSYSF